ncbi:hypothetical protein IC229_19270 [Spirosoma sp. BT702]|uniref:Uncharacterized protein n=1 Tax=Spirosoma profusum TaxID=2771354 RepID=A0A926XYZ3_9BACT|nr:hypothetical protein [Spirosoma profusum]MBD2702796.1 hypothetical protein [Spirosoma profusum]
MIGKKIAERIGRPDLIDILTNELTGSELTSLLLDVFNQKTKQLSPADLLKTYQTNRFVKPADINPLEIRQLENQTLAIFDQFGFSPVELSPVAPLGSCSVVATADQNKILSATRQTEVMADATNALALHIADLKRSTQQQKGQLLRFSTIHRHLRTPTLPDIPGFRSHFKIACFVTSGRDSGNYQFEKEALTEQISMMTVFFRDTLQIDTLRFQLYPRHGYTDPVGFVTTLGNHLHEQLGNVAIDVMADGINDNNYYKGLQYKMTITLQGQTIDIGDGGFVDWTQQFLQNKKERLLTAGIGIELLYRLLQPLRSEGRLA